MSKFLRLPLSCMTNTQENEILTVGSIYDRLSNGYYNPKTDLPPHPQNPCYHHPVRNKRVAEMTQQEYNDFHAALAEYKILEERWNAVVAIRQSEDRILQQMFWNDIAIVCGVADNPKRNKLEAIAWEMGHAGGLGDVFSSYLRIVSLIK